jgi:predicted nucleotidyltransferase
MEIRSITTNLPELSAAYVFGSALKSGLPNDLDVLIVYDPHTCPVSRAYDAHRTFVEMLQQAAGLTVHLTLLTIDEERDSSFIRKTGAISIRSLESLRQ